MTKGNRIASKDGLVKLPLATHTSIATHWLEGSYEIRTVQELLGHNDVRNTMIDNHVQNRRGKGVKSPRRTCEEKL